MGHLFSTFPSQTHIMGEQILLSQPLLALLLNLPVKPLFVVEQPLHLRAETPFLLTQSRERRG